MRPDSKGRERIKQEFGDSPKNLVASSGYNFALKKKYCPSFWVPQVRTNLSSLGRPFSSLCPLCPLLPPGDAAAQSRVKGLGIAALSREEGRFLRIIQREQKSKTTPTRSTLPYRLNLGHFSGIVVHLASVGGAREPPPCPPTGSGPKNRPVGESLVHLQQWGVRDSRPSRTRSKRRRSLFPMPFQLD